MVKKTTGTVVRASDRSIVIRPPRGADLTLRVEPGTSVTLNGLPGRPESLREGMEVRAAYRGGGRAGRTALSIQGTARPPPRDERRRAPPGPEAGAPAPGHEERAPIPGDSG